MELPHLLDDIPLVFPVNDWFHHDGAPPHFNQQAREILDQQYPDPWIGRGGPRHWPPRSPDLNPLDFFLWGHVKNCVYSQPVNTEELRTRIEEAFTAVRAGALSLDTRVKVAQKTKFRRLVTNGSHPF
jgi:hypothetical protein